MVKSMDVTWRDSALHGRSDRGLVARPAWEVYGGWMANPSELVRKGQGGTMAREWP